MAVILSEAKDLRMRLLNYDIQESSRPATFWRYVILSRVDGEGSQASQTEILRRAPPAQNDGVKGGLRLCRAGILRFAQDDGINHGCVNTMFRRRTRSPWLRWIISAEMS